MLQKSRSTEAFTWQSKSETDPYERLRHAAACKLCTWHEHRAASGSVYITIDDCLTLRFADHETTSPRHPSPDFNFVGRDPTEDEFNQIVDLVDYPRWCKKKPFAMHVGLTVQKLNKLLSSECYDTVFEDGYYFGTFKKVEIVVVARALDALEAIGHTKRIPIRQELYTLEDYCGY